MQPSNFFLTFEVSKNVGEEMVPLAEECVRMSVIVFVVHILMAMKSENGIATLLQGGEMIVYAIVGLVTYWLLVRRFVRIN